MLRLWGVFLAPDSGGKMKSFRLLSTFFTSPDQESFKSGPFSVCLHSWPLTLDTRHLGIVSNVKGVPLSLFGEL